MKFCLDCGETVKSFYATYCKNCGYKHRMRPSGLKYDIKVQNKSWFCKGHIPWDKDKKGLIVAWNKGIKGSHYGISAEFKAGCEPWNKGIDWVEKRGVNNHNWKGDAVGYEALHGWVRKYLGVPLECYKCGSRKNVEWANKSKEYKRELEDWMPLCKSCHHVFDDIYTKGWATRKKKEALQWVEF